MFKEDDIKFVILISHTFFKINDSCLQFWGGMGFTTDVEISRSYRWKKIYWKIFLENSLKHRKFLLLPKLNLREGSRYQIRWIFGKVPKGGGGSFSIQKFMLQILGTLNRAFWAWNWYKKSKFRVQGMFFQQLYWEKSKQDTLWRRHVHAFHTIWPSCLLAYMQP